MIREEVAKFAALAPLPPSSADASLIRRYEEALERITPPVTCEEASALTAWFGEDDCFGLAWTLLHLIESSPTPAVPNDPGRGVNRWLLQLWERSDLK